MKTQAFRCDTCGGEIRVESRFAALVSCRYCNTVYTLNNNQLNKTQVTEPLRAISVFSVGETWTYLKKPLTILGRAEFDDGEDVWDEWFVTWNNLPRWIEESDGQLTFFEKKPLTGAVSQYEDIAIGESISVGQNTLFVAEKGTGTLTGIEGELPGKTTIGEHYQFIQAHAEDGTIWAIEYTPTSIALHEGNMIEGDQLQKLDLVGVLQ